MARLSNLAFAILLVAVPCYGDHGGKHGRYEREDRDEDDRGPQRYFRSGDARLIQEHCRIQSLPPGLQKKLYRTGHLPPGWEKRFQPFPAVVERQLPPVCVGCRRGLFGSFAIVFNERTSVIVDIVALR